MNLISYGTVFYINAQTSADLTALTERRGLLGRLSMLYARYPRYIFRIKRD